MLGAWILGLVLPLKCRDVALRSAAPAPNFASSSHLWQTTFRHEMTDNMRSFIGDPDQILRMQLVEVPAQEVEWIEFAPVDPRLKRYFYKDDSTYYWWRHPHSSNVTAPYALASAARAVDARHTASRSALGFQPDAPAFSVKSGTDHLRPTAKALPDKALTRKNVDRVRLRQPFLNAVSRLLPQDDVLILVNELLLLRHRATGEGVLVRDLSSLDSDNHYVTALSYPTYGPEIARRLKLTLYRLTRDTYAVPLGRAKARLLLFYGLLHTTPNAQNMLTEFNAAGRPTGRIALRDLGDTIVFGPYLDALGLDRVRAANQNFGFPLVTEIKLGTPTSFMYFEVPTTFHHDRSAFTNLQLYELMKAHDQAFINEVQLLLGIRRPISLQGLGDYLVTVEGQAAWRDLHRRLGTLPYMTELDRIGASVVQR